MTNEEFIQSVALPGEEWRNVVGYEGYYIVSNFGRIATIRNSCKRTFNGRTYSMKMKRHICNTSIAPSTNYRRITFKRDCVRDTKLVHRVVAEAFIPNPNHYSCIDHIDDNPQNNNVNNLQWCTYKINNSKEHHRKASSQIMKGKPAHNRKKIVQLLNGNIIRILDYMTQLESEGYSHSAIHRVCKGKLKSHKGFQWMYLSDYESQASMSKNSKTYSD